MLEFSLSHLIKLTHYTYRSISQAIISVLSELVTPEVLQPTPLKRISSRDSEQEIEEGKTRLYFVNLKLHERLHDFER